MTLKAAGGFAFAIVGAVLSGPKIEAAIFNQRLRRLSEHPTPQSPKIASALLASANEERVVVGKAAVEQIVAHRLTLEDVSNAVIATVNQSAIDRSIELPIAAVRVKKKTVTGEIILNGMSGELRPGNLLTLGVDPRVASLVYPDMTAFFGPIGSAVTSPQYAGAGYIVVDGREGTIVIPLDGLHCKNVIFLKCTLVYAGKAVKLDNTGFGNSQFEFSANLACQELAEAILKNPALNYSRP